MNHWHWEILEQGENAWNNWRKDYSEIMPDLSNAYLDSEDLSGVNFNDTNLYQANLSSANLFTADLIGANLQEANLQSVDFRDADLERADLSKAYLGGAIFNGANLRDADFAEATFNVTTFGNNDLSNVKGLLDVVHGAPSFIGIDSIYRSDGNIPEGFLRGCGVPDDFITFMHSLATAKQPIQFYSCFISYSSQDEEFAKRLHSRMRDAHLRVWFAPEDVEGGKKLHEQIDQAIRLYDKLLLVLSENSMQSEWVMTETRKARKAEMREKRQKLFPIRLVNFEKIQEWECFDADTGKDLAVEVREFFIPDFSDWKAHDSFEAAFSKLLKNFKAVEDKKSNL